MLVGGGVGSPHGGQSENEVIKAIERECESIVKGENHRPGFQSPGSKEEADRMVEHINRSLGSSKIMPTAASVIFPV